MEQHGHSRAHPPPEDSSLGGSTMGTGQSPSEQGQREARDWQGAVGDSRTCPNVGTFHEARGGGGTCTLGPRS